MRGRVTEHLEIVFALEARTEDQQTERVDAVLDTGYAGSLAVPRSLAQALSVAMQGARKLVLADGDVVLVERCLLSVIVDAREVEVLADVIGGEVLVSTSFVEGARLEVDMVPGGRAEVIWSKVE